MGSNRRCCRRARWWPGCRGRMVAGGAFLFLQALVCGFHLGDATAYVSVTLPVWAVAIEARYCVGLIPVKRRLPAPLGLARTYTVATGAPLIAILGCGYHYSRRAVAAGAQEKNTNPVGILLAGLFNYKLPSVTKSRRRSSFRTSGGSALPCSYDLTTIFSLLTE